MAFQAAGSCCRFIVQKQFSFCVGWTFVEGVLRVLGKRVLTNIEPFFWSKGLPPSHTDYSVAYLTSVNNAAGDYSETFASG